MTITGLWKYYKDHVGYEVLSVKEFSGQLLANDISVFMYATRCVSKEYYLSRINPFIIPVDENDIDTIWLKKALDSLKVSLRKGFCPIFVYDGEKDSLKLDTLATRQQESIKAQAEIDALYKKYEGVDMLDIPSSAVKRVKELLIRVNRMPFESKQKFFDFFNCLGIPWVQSAGEGERTCALMNRDGVVPAVISVDGDCLACGAKLVLLRDANVYNEDGFGSPAFEVARLDSMLDKLEMSEELFIELCIMAGTDFNKNIPKIGFVKSIKLLMDHGSISKIGAKTKHDISILNHREVRKRFERVPWQSTVKDACFEVTFDDVREIKALERYNLVIDLVELTKLKQKFITLREKRLSEQ